VVPLRLAGGRMGACLVLQAAHELLRSGERPLHVGGRSASRRRRLLRLQPRMRGRQIPALHPAPSALPACLAAMVRTQCAVSGAQTALKERTGPAPNLGQDMTINL